MPTWRFEPVLVDGKATAAQAKMNMKFIARKRADDSVAVALRSAWFAIQEVGSRLKLLTPLNDG